jgi:formate dehydrogenase beta subunit
MTEKIKLYDESRCIACRACQVACKQWNGLKALPAVHRGAYQNPPSLSPNNFMLIHFQDYEDNKDGKLKWLFRKEACMHCTDAACVMVCPSGALHYNKETKTVGVDHDKCIGCKACVAACPFEIPRYDAKTDKVYKCDMCESRIMSNLEPACVKACPTGALKWGPKEDLLKYAAKRADKLGGDAATYGDKYVKGTHFMYVLKEKPAAYAGMHLDPSVPLSIIVWKDLLKPLSLLAAGGVIAGSFLHYIIHGPKTPDEDTEAQQKGEE